MTAARPAPRFFTGSGPRRPRTGRLTRQHVLMLALALEVLGVGICNADRYRPPGTTVEQTIVEGHVIT